MTIGQRIKARRKELGISAEKLAESLGISPATVYRYEKGDIEKMPGDLLEPLAKALYTTPAFLMGWDDKGLSELSNLLELAANDNRLELATDILKELRQKRVSSEDIKAAFWGGDKDLSQEDIDELWDDVKDYARYKAEQKKRRKQ